jgi:TP901 family phage tail tape measure protein
MAYVAVYGGFNEIIGKMKEMIQMNLQLSDSMADVQKTTGLSGIELQELGRSLERIDTRTTTAELYQLAAAAGQIGLKTQEDVLGFAKAANTISVALNELGAEGSASLMKIATLTGEVQRYGTEQALTRVGSAINELTANSAATAGPIADFISRVGGIASASKMAIHEMAALGAATDASAQSIEIAGTSMNKFITALVSNTENIAYATNLNAQELQSLIN